MASIIVDGISYEVDPANNMLQECLSHALDLPYFCWHPCMGSVGACRQCAVKQYRDADDRNGTIVMACMTPAADGAIVSIRDAQAVKFRASVIESLMISHPHDCPVCEEGGECHLQDMTQMSGHNYRRYDFNKVTHRNQYLGPFINHEMNRCITCYRCVRFYNDYAGGSDLAALASHHHVYFGRHEEGTLENEFSGNLVEVCPTGVFTDKTFSAHYTRKWDLQTAPSICTGCGTGCNTTPGEREGTLRRIVNRYHHDLNGYFLCDRGRFGYAYGNSASRITSASERGPDNARQPLSTEAARARFATLTDASTSQIIGISSPRASLEDNFALRELVGEENFYAGFSDGQYACMRAVIDIYRDENLHCPDIRSLEQCDCVLIIGEDITNTAPRLALAVRQASRSRALHLAVANRIPLWQDAAVRSLAQDSRSPVFIIGPQATRLDDVAEATSLAGTEGQLALLAAITAVFDAGSRRGEPEDEAGKLAIRIADALAAASRPVIISGISQESEALIAAMGALARTVQHHTQEGDIRTGICFALPEVNTMGLALMLDDSANTLEEALQRIIAGSVDTVIVLENDLSRRSAAASIGQAFDAGVALLVIDQLHNTFNEAATLLLPGTTFAEQNSTWVNYEGRAQESYQVFQPDPARLPAREWLRRTEVPAADFPRHLELLRACASTLPVFQPLQAFATDNDPGTLKTPRQPHRFSGRTALKAAESVHETRRPDDPGSPLSFSMEGMPPLKDARLLAAAWAPGWNSNQAISKFQDEVNGPLRQGCPGIHLRPLGAGTGFPQCKTPHDGLSQADTGGFDLFFIEHIFGGDELSAAAPAIAARASGAYLSIGMEDAGRVGLAQYGLAQIDGADCTVRLPVLIRKEVAPGMVGIYCGDEINRYAFGASVNITPVRQEGLIASSRQMFDALIVPDRAREGP